MLIYVTPTAKTVVFTQTRKFDGKDFRWITSGEYIQMSGRAGRRGKDDKGNVIQMLDEKMEPKVAKDMIYGASDPLYSSYKVGYNMVLNMLRVEDADPENLLKSSFHQYQQEQNAPELERQAYELLEQAQEITFTDVQLEGKTVTVTEEDINEYYTLTSLAKKITYDVYQIVLQPKFVLPFLNSGRLIKIEAYGVDWGYGMLVSHRKVTGDGVNINGFAIGFDHDAGNKKTANTTTPSETIVLDVLLNVKTHPVSKENNDNDNDNDENTDIQPAAYSDKSSEMVVIRVALRCITALSQVRMTVPKDLTKESTRKNVQNMIKEVFRRLQNTTTPAATTVSSSSALPLLHPIKDIGITEPDLQTLYDRSVEVQSKLEKLSFHTSTLDPALKESLLLKLRHKLELLQQSKLLLEKSKENQTVTMKEELKKMKRVLRRLEFISPEGVLGVKGRFSCELSIADELVLSEMVGIHIFIVNIV